MSREIVKCSCCGKTIVPEEVEIGHSLVCPSCDPKNKNDDQEKEKDAANQ